MFWDNDSHIAIIDDIESSTLCPVHTKKCRMDVTSEPCIHSFIMLRPRTGQLQGSSHFQTKCVCLLEVQLVSTCTWISVYWTGWCGQLVKRKFACLWEVSEFFSISGSIYFPLGRQWSLCTYSQQAKSYNLLCWKASADFAIIWCFVF